MSTSLRWTLALVAALSCAGCCSAPPPPHLDVPVLDMHVHTFNARHLPLQGLLAAHAEARGVHLGETEVAGLARLLWKLTGSEPAGFVEGAPEGEPPAEVPPIELEPEERALLRDVRARARGAGVAAVAVDEALQDDAELLASALQEVGFLADRAHPAGAGAGPEAFGPSLRGYLRFVLTLLSSEARMAQRLHATFPEVDLFVDHMMDLENTYSTPAFHPLEERVRRSIGLARSSGDVLTFAAWCPFRTGDALAAIQEARARGAIGVKFYPPNGYRPSGNAIQERPAAPVAAAQWDSQYGLLGGCDPAAWAARLDALNEALFAWCEDRGVPILAHTNAGGFEVRPGSGAWNCDPEHWADVLARHPDLRVAFAHAGGEADWLRAAEWPTEFDERTAGRAGPCRKSFPQKVWELSRTYANVYVCFGYHAFGSREEAERLGDGLAALFAADERGGHPYRFAHKAMFGSDWSMSAKEPDPRRSLENFAAVFARQPLALRARFFAGNAAAWLLLAERRDDPVLSEAQREAIAGVLDALEAVEGSPARAARRVAR